MPFAEVELFTRLQQEQSHTTVLGSAVPIQRRGGRVIYKVTLGITVTINSIIPGNTALARIVTFTGPNL